MTESQDQELEYVPINDESILSELVIRLVAISDPDLLDGSPQLTTVILHPTR